MKTAIRTFISNPESFNGTDGKFQFMHIQILDGQNENNLTPIGEIIFQMTVGDPKGYRWYGIQYYVKTDKFEHLKKMAKLAEFIRKNSNWDSQPDEIKHLIGAQEHIHFEGMFIPVSDNGKNIYKVMENGEYYTNIIAVNDIMFQKIVDKRKFNNATFEFFKKIEFDTSKLIKV